MLENINRATLKAYDKKQLASLSCEIRQTIIESVAQNGGHLSSNLGMVEATIALHRVFDIPNDTLVFDVGHQAYTHKLLTGRADRFDSLRAYGGISGFTNREESDCDFATAGHSGSALSMAMGKAESNTLQNNHQYVIAVIGDGSFTNGMTFEALDACASLKNLRLIILLNDNEMSISKNVGGLSNHFSRVRSSGFYYDFKRRTERVLSRIPLIGKGLAAILKKIKDILKRFAVGNTIFDSLGINFLGTVDGNDEERLEEVFKEAKRRSTCCIIHMTTKKGKGYEFAEQHPDEYHSVSPFDVNVGVQPSNKGFSYQFGQWMCEKAKNHDNLCAVTAAMMDGTGLSEFGEKYPERLFDVGIAEEHATAFCSGMALGGFIPVFAVYSTFAQRVFDQMIHDVSLQKSHVIFAIDRAGIVCSDGVTHHGVFDVAMMSLVPNMTIYSPDSYEEQKECLDKAFVETGSVAVRYPRGGELSYNRECMVGDDIKTTSLEPKLVSIITYGRLTSNVMKAIEGLEAYVKVIKLVKVFPLDLSKLDELVFGSKKIVVYEEGIKEGGIGEKIAALWSGVEVHAIDQFVPHGDAASLDRILGFDPQSIQEEVIKAIQ